MEKREIKEILDRFDFVKWDRVIPWSVGGGIDVYGWIERQKDCYKDFVILSIVQLDNGWFIHECFTSSAKYSKKINELSGFSIEEHIKCIKIDEYLESK